MNRIQKFITSTPDLVLTYKLQPQTYQLSKKDPFILESKSSITFLLASKIHLTTNQFRSVLKSFLFINSFYSLAEYFTWNSNTDLGLV